MPAQTTNQPLPLHPDAHNPQRPAPHQHAAAGDELRRPGHGHHAYSPSPDSSPTLASTVAQLVVDRPARSRIFQKLGIDFCCGGKIPLEEAARRKGLDPRSVLAMLEASDDGAAAGEIDVSKMGLAELCDHIEQTHHAYLRAELPRLHAMLQRVATVHGESHPWMRRVLEVFEPFVEELADHMMSEETVLFPQIRRQEAGSAKAGDACAVGSGGDACGVGTAGGSEEMDATVSEMEQEHAAAGAALARMRELTAGYSPPPGACTTFRAALDALHELERDMHRHVHKENNILFPRALEQRQSPPRETPAPDTCALG